MPLSPGSHLGPYEVLALIGAGGMGEVYRARDTKLNRDVAIKVLPDLLADVPDRHARFEREAQALAALNHPHIAQIYGVEETGSAQTPTVALVMELVEGPTLADLLASRGRLPTDEAIKIAQQVADALEAAHTAGIVHRDLKPANIKVRADGIVKVLDFGLARMADPAAGSATHDSPTFTSPAVTAHGVILGTAAYMSPEQARGRPVDQRADIWAFGCVLYQMLAGHAPFDGETVTDLLAAVVRAEPDWTRLPASVPSRLGDLVRRCVRKDVRQRLQAIGDARIALEEIAAAPASRNADHRDSGRRSTRRAWLLGSLVGVAIGALAASLVLGRVLQASAPPQPVTRFTIRLPAGQTLAALDRRAVALSDDGRELAYVALATASGASQIYVRPMDGADARPIPGTEHGVNPFFSPDGQWLAFFADGKLKKVAVRGGEPQNLTDVTNSFGGSWAGNHTIAFVPLASAIQQVSDAGGTPAPLTQMLPGETIHAWPARFPDGVLFTASSAKGLAIAFKPLGAGERRDVIKGQGGSMPSYARSGHLVYAQNGTLMALPFDLRQLQVASDAPAVPVLKGVWQSTGLAQFSLSENGSLAYVAGPTVVPRNRLVWVARSGVVQPLNAPERVYYQPRLSPDGHKVVIDLVDAPRIQIGLYEIELEVLAPFTFEGSNRHGVWTQDSKYIIFQSNRDGTQRIYWQPADGSGRPEPLMSETLPASDGVFNIPYSVSAGRVLTYVKLFPTNNAQFWSLLLPAASAGATSPTTNGNGQQFLEATTADGAPELSPDGHWLAYASDESGDGRQLYVRAFPGPGGPWQVSTSGGSEPRWNPNGKEIFYRTGRRMMASEVETATGFRAGKPRELFEGDFTATLNGYVRANYVDDPASHSERAAERDHHRAQLVRGAEALSTG